MVLLSALSLQTAIWHTQNSVSAAQTIPYKINFQGKLTDGSGNILPDGAYNVKFRIMDAASGGTNLFEEDYIQSATDNRINVVNGTFNVQFGSLTALSPSLFNTSAPRYLEVELPTPATVTCATNGCAVFTEGPMTPRQALASAAYAFNSDTIDGIDGSSLARNDAANTFTGNTQLFKNASDSVTGFQIQSAGSATSIFNVDTQNARIGIGNNAPNFPLDVTGEIRTSTQISVGSNTSLSTSTLTIGGTAICTATGCTASASSSNLQAAYGGSTGGTTPEIKLDSTRGAVDIQDANTSIAANLLNVRASNGSGLGAILLGVGATGQITLQNSADSTSALLLKNQAGTTDILHVDTTNQRVGINISTPTAPLHVATSNGGTFSDGFEDNNMPPFSGATWATSAVRANTGSYSATATSGTMTITKTLTSAGTIDYYRYLKSTGFGHTFIFLIDGVAQETVGANNAWLQRSWAVGAGTHTFTWNESGEGAWIDDVTITNVQSSPTVAVFEGNVGIGTASPSYLVDIAAGVNATSWAAIASNAATGLQGGLLLHQNSTYGFQAGTTGTSSATGSLVFDYRTISTGAVVQSNILALQGNGYVGIGNIAPNAGIDVNTPSNGFTDTFEDNTLTPFSGATWSTTNLRSNTGNYSATATTGVMTITKTLSSAGTVSYYRYLKSTGFGHTFIFQIDGVTQETVGANNAWLQRSWSVGAGTHTFTWNESGEGAWIDDVQVTNAGSSYAALFNGGNVGVGTASPAATFQANGTALFTSAANSTTAFQIQNAASTSTLLNADTTNLKLTVNQSNLVITGLGAPTAPGVAAGANQGGTLSGAGGTTYYYKISALNAAGESVGSSEVNIPGSSFTALTAPTAPTVAINATAGNLNGAYTYKVTFVTANGETTGGTTSGTVSPVSQQVNLTAIPTGPTGTTARKIYRTAAGGADGTQKLVTTIADNTTTIYTDNLADGSLGAALPGSNTARTNTNNATITFTGVTGATSYRIYRGTATGAESAYQTTASSPFTDTGAAGTAGTVLAYDSTARLGVGTATPSYSIDTVGDINASNSLKVAGVTVCTSTGCTASASSSNLQAAYNGSTGSTTPEIKLDSTRGGLDIQDADTPIAANLLNVRASNGSGLGAALFSVGATGQITFQNSANSNAALVLKNQAGTTDILRVDSTNQFVGINVASPGAPLHVGLSTSPTYTQGFETGSLPADFTTGGANFAVDGSNVNTGSFSAHFSSFSNPWIETTKVFNATGTVSFWYLPAFCCGGFSFNVDGVPQSLTPLGGNMYSVTVPAGSHALRWQASFTCGSCHGYIDDISITNLAASTTSAIFNGNVSIGSGSLGNFLLDVTTGGNAKTWAAVSSSAATNLQGGLLFHQNSTNGFQIASEGTAGLGQLVFDYRKISDGSMVQSNILALTGMGFVGVGTQAPMGALDVQASAGKYNNGFESGGFTSDITVSATGTVVVDATAPHTGSSSVHFSGGGSQFFSLTKTFPGAGSISYWRLPSTCCGSQDFYIDGVNQESLNGGGSWTQRTFAVAAGTHTFKWQANFSCGGACNGYVDDISMTGVNSTTAAVFNGGKVGIGTYTPTADLQVNSSSTTAFQVQNAAGTSTLLNADASGLKVTVAQGQLVLTGIPTPAAPGIAAGSNQGGSLSAANTYYYKITALNAAGESVASSEASIAGTSFTAIATPTAPTVAINATAGNLNGAYTYKITFVTANGETTGGTTSGTVSPVSQQVNLTAIPLGATGTTARKIYRTAAGGADGTQKLVTTIADNTTTIYTDNTADGSLGATLPGSNTARTNTNNATVTFTAITGATSYRIYRGTSAGNESAYQTTAATPFTDTGAAGTAGTPRTTDSSARLAVGTATPSYSIDAVGDINASTSLKVGGVTVCTSAGCTATGTTLQQTYTPSTGGTIPEIKLDGTRGAIDIQDADTTIAANLFNIRSSNGSGLGNILLGVGSTGQTLLQNSVDSTTALQVKNVANSVLLNVNTTAGYVGVNRADAQASLHVGLSPGGTYTQDFENVSIPTDFTAVGSVGIDNTVFHGGARSIKTSGSGNPYFETTKTMSAAATVSYWRNVPASAGAGLIFAIDGVTQESIVNVPTWNQASFSVSAGTHTFRWTQNTVCGSGCAAFVDDIAVTNVSGGPISALFDGNVGIGTLSPTAALHVVGTQPASVSTSGTAATAGALFQAAKGGNTSGTTGQTAGNGGGLTFTAGDGGDAASGSTNGSGGTITLAAGAAGSGAGTAGSAGSVIVKNTANSAAALQVQNTSGTAVVTVDTLNSQFIVRNGTDNSSLGSELFTSISNCSGTNWTVAANATHTVGSSAVLSCSSPAVTAGQWYQVVFTTSGSPTSTEYVYPSVGLHAGPKVYGNSGETQTIAAAITGTLDFTPSTNWNGVISAISIKALTIAAPVVSIQGSAGGVIGGIKAYSNNIALGNQAAQSLTSATGNTAVGYTSLQATTVGSSNSAFGSQALVLNSIGGENSAFGYFSLFQNTTGFYNTAVGTSALYTNSNGTYNTALGYKAGYTDGDNFKGIPTSTNASSIGSFAISQASNSLVLGSVGSSGNTKVGIGTTVPQNTLSVSPIDYSAGTASRAGSTVTGVGTTWTAAMIGEQFIFADGTTGTITARASNTSITLSTSGTVASQNYRIHRIGFQVTSGGDAYVQNTSTTALQVKNTASTAVLTVDTTNSQSVFQGINNTATIGSELITTSNFTNAVWTKAGWTVAATTATHNSGNTSPLTTTQVAVVAGNTYQITFSLATVSPAGESVTPRIGGVDGIPTNGFSTQTQLITANTTGVLTFTPTSGWIGTISAVSVKLVTSSNAQLVVKDSGAVTRLEVRAAANSFGMGLSALSSNTTGIYNTAVGLSVLRYNTTGRYNSGLGQYALQNNTDGYYNTAVGYDSLFSNTTGNGNTAIGMEALSSNGTGSYNTALGTYAMMTNTTGSYNVAIGDQAAGGNTTGSENTALGHWTLQSNTTGDNNTALGYEALNGSYGDDNTAVGHYALFTNDGNDNVALGSSALKWNGTGSNNIGIGTDTLSNNTTGSLNVGVGYNALYNNDTGTNMTALGAWAGSVDDDNFSTWGGLQNATAIGANAQVQASNALVLGSIGTSGTVKVGIGTTIPQNTLSVSPLNVNAGTASQSGNTVTGVGTSWNSALIGQQFIFEGGETGTITAVASTTSLTLSTSQTLSSRNYRIHYIGLQVTSTGNVGIGTASPSASLHVVGNALFQPVSLTNGQTGVGVTSSTANTTAGGSVMAASLSLTNTGGNNTTATTTKGQEIIVTDNASALANTDIGLNISLSGTNTKKVQYGVRSTVSTGVGGYFGSQGIPVSGNDTSCGVDTGNYGIGICAESDQGAGVYAWAQGGGTTLEDFNSAAVYGINDSGGGGGNFYAGLLGTTRAQNAAAYTASGVVGVGQAGTGANVYGGYFTLTSNNDATAGAVLYASNAAEGVKILQLQDGTTDVVTIADGGAAVFKNQTNSAAGFQIQNSSNTPLLVADTSGMTVTVVALIVTGNLTANGHIITGGSAPAIAAGAAACTTPAVSISGNDTSGLLTVTTGSGCASTGILATVTFSATFGSSPRVVLTPAETNSTNLKYYVDSASISSTSFDLDTGTTPVSSTTYKWYYHTLQ